MQSSYLPEFNYGLDFQNNPAIRKNWKTEEFHNNKQDLCSCFKYMVNNPWN